MNQTMNLTEEMGVREVRSRREVPAWAKAILYTVLGAATWKGLMVTGQEAMKAYTRAKYAYISGVISDELDGKSFRLTPDLRDNKRHQFGDMSPAHMSMAIYTLSHELSQCESLRSTVHEMTVGIETVRDTK